MTNQGSRCKLCGDVGPLCRSHIVPAFLYEPIKNAKGQLYEVGLRTRKVQDGHSEHMLCPACEALLSGYERGFKHLWMDAIPADLTYLQESQRKEAVSVAVTDYDVFKLFHLSVFWRAAVSESFKIGRLSLGPYADQLATLIRTHDPGELGDFPLVGALNFDGAGRPVAAVSQLAKGEGRFEGHHYYMMNYAFCDWTFVVARPGPAWMVALERMCREEKKFLLLTTPHHQSKSSRLWAQIIGDLRK